jgi:hypothetical protein
MRVIITILLLAACTLAEKYASPAGSGTACTIGSPCALKYAVANCPGETLWLRGGTYTGKFALSSASCTVRNYPNETPVLDGYVTGTITGSLDAVQTTINFGGTYAFTLGDDIKISNGEIVHIFSGTSPTFDVVRGWAGTTATTHSASAPWRLEGTNLSITGSGVPFWGIEVTESNPTRAYPGLTGGSGGQGGGISIAANDVSVINCVVHDTLNGIGKGEIWQRALVYGNIIFANGYVADDRGHGHGIYLQNLTGRVVVQENISFNNFGLGSQFYGATAGRMNNLVLEGFIGFNNGSPTFYAGNPTGLTGRRYGNLLVGTDVEPTTDAYIKNAYLYEPTGMTVETGGITAGRLPTGGNNDLTIIDSYVAEPLNILTVDQWADVTVRGNTFYATDNVGDATVAWSKLATGIIDWDANAYYAPVETDNCTGGSFIAPFIKTGSTGVCGSFLRWAEWKAATGYDANSTYAETAPTGQQIFVRENAYARGRNHIVVYNWSGAGTAAFTPKGLYYGQTYTIVDVQNWGTTYASGTYTGGTISISMSGTTVRTPTGHSYTPPTTKPTFGVFVLIPGALPAAKGNYFGAVPPPIG